MQSYPQPAISAQALQYFEAAVAWHTQGHLEPAVRLYQQTLALEPHYFPALSNLGAALQKLRRFEEAISAYQAALAITQQHAPIQNNLAVALREVHRLEECFVYFDEALQLVPQYPEALVNRGYAHYLCGHFEAAIRDYEQAKQIDPQFAAAYFNLGMTQLALGNFQAGWFHYEWRYKADPYARERRFAPHQTRYDGHQDVAGKTILLYGEQGLGDSLQFCRFAKRFLTMGAHVILQVPRPLVEICKSLDPTLRVIADDEDTGDFDLQCPLMSLPLALSIQGPDPQDAPGYLQADASKARQWHDRLAPLKRLRVGLVWSGGFRPAQPETWETNNRRNMPLHQLQAFAHLAADFVSLQKGQPAEGELAQALAQQAPLPVLHAFADQLQDFSDTAALISQLDLVISVDTSTAHLAAALGKPTWILHRFDACWRWMLHPAFKRQYPQAHFYPSPWYDAVRSYHQTTDGDWASLITLVTQDLQDLINNHTSSNRQARLPHD